MPPYWGGEDRERERKEKKSTLQIEKREIKVFHFSFADDMITIQEAGYNLKGKLLELII
jgi:hypothetical protein